MGGSPFLSYLLVDLHLILKNSAGIHAGSDIQCELLQWVKKLRPKSKLEQTWPSRRMDSSTWRLCRVVSRAQSSLSRTLNWEEGEDLLFCAMISYHFGPRERRCRIDRIPFRMDTCGSPADPALGDGARRRPGRGDSGSKRRARGRVSASNSADGSPSRPTECVPVILVA